MDVKRRVFSFVEVRASGRPAYFWDYGETLVYVRDQLFDVREWRESLVTGTAPAPLPAALLESPVGIEYGWCHAEACTCSSCRGRPPLELVAQPLVVSGLQQRSALRQRSGAVAASPQL
jgi:hypothetical protein